MEQLRQILKRTISVTIQGVEVVLRHPALEQAMEVQRIRFAPMQSIQMQQGKMPDNMQLDAAETNKAAFMAAQKALLVTMVNHDLTEDEVGQLVLASGGPGSDLCMAALDLCGVQNRQPGEDDDDLPLLE